MKQFRSHIRKLLREYFTNDVVYLKRYFTSSDEERAKWLPQEYPYYFEDFVAEMDVELDFEFPKNEPFDEDLQDYEKMEWLENNHPNVYKAFGKYLFHKIGNHEIDIPDSELPAWTYFSNHPENIKNQWLIHFTKNADDIAKQGFKYGVGEMEKLGLTTSLGEFEKKYGGYNFAYTLRDFERYGAAGYNKYKYGDEAVIFNASGIRLYHHGDEEPQVIFYGNTARNIIPIINDEETGWTLSSIRNGQTLFYNEKLSKVVDWLTVNYNQYRKHLHR
jgi:hypothetical protein